MSYHPDYRENLADGVLKDLNIENLLRELEHYKKLARQWCPMITVDENAKNGTAIQWSISLNADGTPHGLSYVMSKEEAQYLAAGDTLVNQVAEQLSTIFEIKLREELDWRIKKTLTNLKLQERTKP